MVVRVTQAQFANATSSAVTGGADRGRTALRWAAAIVVSLLGAELRADEGMWTFDNFPSAVLKQRYGVDTDAAWLDRLQRSVTRHESGCSGSFVSPRGLVLTNQHCVIQCLSDLSSPERNHLADGFAGEERRCPREMLSVLVETENITPQINRATAGLDSKQASKVRKQTLTKLEHECNARSSRKGHACESVSLYQGGQYFLYKYRRYDDVHMVFAPHHAVASFGGDPDNFNFPRWGLDFSLLRVYENGKPAHTPHYLRWRVEGPKAQEPVFVAGHPASTSRLHTAEQLRFQRDTFIPSYLVRNSELRGRLIQWSTSGAEPARIARQVLPGYENSLKIYRSLQLALFDESMLHSKREQEQALRQQIAADSKLAAVSGAWDEIAAAQAAHRRLYARYAFLEGHPGFSSQLFGYARQLVRAASERNKPDGQRLREYAESNQAKLAAALLAPAPVDAELDRLTFAFSLDKMRETLGPDDPMVRRLLSNSTPESFALARVSASKLADATERKRLWDGGQAAIAASQDPMIVLAREVDEDARAIRRQYEDEVQAVVDSAQERIAMARFAILGTNTYPDATFTLRLSYGAVSGWDENGTVVEPFTHLDRMYERATPNEPFSLPQIWLDARSRLDARLPFNYVTTNDIVGGNSGSAVVDAQGRLVGLAFDGNSHSIAGRFWYDPRLNRAIAVHPAIIMAALREVYGKNALAAEILGGQGS